MNIRQEKWLLAAAVVVFPLSAFAQPGYDNTSALRILSDPAYLPFAGQFEGTTAYHYDQASGDVFDSTGAPDYTFHTITDTISQSLQYGLTDDLSFQFGISYDPSQKRNDIFPDGSMKSLQSNGFTDPSFGVTWRAIDQANGPMNLDLSASYDPDAFNAEISLAQRRRQHRARRTICAFRRRHQRGYASIHGVGTGGCQFLRQQRCGLSDERYDRQARFLLDL